MNRSIGVFFGVVLFFAMMPFTASAYSAAPTDPCNGYTNVADSGWVRGIDGENFGHSVVWKHVYNGSYCAEQHGQSQASCTFSDGYCDGEPIYAKLWMYNGSWHLVEQTTCHIQVVSQITTCNTAAYYSAATCHESFHEETQVWNGTVKEVDVNSNGWTNC